MENLTFGNNMGGFTGMEYSAYDGGAMGFEGMGGPSIDGNWFNPHTGDYFIVSDSYFENDDCIVLTRDGRRLNYNILQDYVQTKESEAVLKQRKQEIQNQKNAKPTQKRNPIELQESALTNKPVDTFGGADMVDDDIFDKPFTPQIQQPIQQKPVIKDEQIIERALGKTEAPDMDIVLSFVEFPEKEISMLTDIMNVEVADIAAWMYNKYFEKDFKNIIIDKIVEKLHDPQSIQIKEVDEKPVEQVEPQVTKTKKKKK